MCVQQKKQIEKLKKTVTEEIKYHREQIEDHQVRCTIQTLRPDRNYMKLFVCDKVDQNFN